MSQNAGTATPAVSRTHRKAASVADGRGGSEEDTGRTGDADGGIDSFRLD